MADPTDPYSALVRSGLTCALACAAAASLWSLPAAGQESGGSAPDTADPIIPDREFDAAIPVLGPDDDPELGAPLESIEDFERRMVEQGKGAEQAGDPVAPGQDAELAAPLAPLEQIAELPPTLAEERPTAAPEISVAYRTQLEGLEVADKQAEADLLAAFNALSALRKGKGLAGNLAMIRARLAEDSQLLQTILAAQGWYAPAIRSRLVVPKENGDGEVVALLSVDPGQRYAFSEIVIDSAPTDPPDLIQRNLSLRPGEPILADQVLTQESRVAVALPENGYPFAELGERDIVLDREAGTGRYVLPVRPGPRGRFKGFATSGKLAFGVDHLKVLARFREGELYDSRRVDDLRKALVATGLFSAVSVEPQRTGEAAAGDTEYVTLDVRQEAGPPRTIAGTIGYATGQGLTAKASWTHRNLFPPEGALILQGVAGTQEQGLGATFRRANAGARDRTVELTVEALRNDYEAYDAYTGRIAGRISRDSTPLWQKRLTYAFGFEALATGETDFDPATGARTRKAYYVAGANGQLGLDGTDDLLNPAKGYRLTGLIQPEATLNKGFNPYLRGRIEASAYLPVADALVIAGRVRLGMIQGADLQDIAPSRRLYVGGGGSVRGFGYHALGEVAPDGRPTGGRSSAEGSLEARYRFGYYGVVAFIDAGQAWRETTPQFNDLRYGLGIGGRFYTNFGPVRVDIATPLGRKADEARFNVYVSIGQAF